MKNKTRIENLEATIKLINQEPEPLTPEREAQFKRSWQILTDLLESSDYEK